LYKVVASQALSSEEIKPFKPQDAQSVISELGGEFPIFFGAQEREFNRLLPLVTLVAAQEKAQKMIEEAEQLVESIRKQAREEGLREGREQSKQDVMVSLVAFAQTGQNLIILEEQLISGMAPHIVRLAIEIAGKVVAKAVEEDPEITASILERAKKEIPHAKSLQILLHPADFQLLKETRPDLINQGGEGQRKIEIYTSEEVGRGGCRLETEMGVVDATIPMQMEEIGRQMLDEEEE